MNSYRLARRMPTSVLAASILVCGLMMTGCSSGVAADAAPTSAPTPTPSDDGKPASAEGTPIDSAVAATCATVSTINTSLENARRDRSLGTVSPEQYIALVESAYTGYRSLTAFPESQRGLRGEFGAILAYIEANPDTGSGARFDPAAAGYWQAQEPIMEACRSNLSELAVFSTTGG